ncbi:MAG: heme ABC exporter ATP-binding protein CcmA [Rhodothalassiaceae bacterium]
MSMNALRLETLGCRRGGRLLFSGLDAGIAPGEALLLHGPNGSGKSSLLRLLAGLAAPASGRILIDGVPAGREDLNALGLYAGHALALKPMLSVADNLVFWIDCLGGRRTALEAALDSLALAPLAALPVGRLSAGQQRRVSLARLLLVERPFWLLDEPMTALDRDSVGRVEAMISAHLAKGGMAAIATHAPLAFPGVRLDLAACRPDWPEEAA